MEQYDANSVDSMHIHAISDDRAGNLRQAQALADALAAGARTDTTRLQPRAPWRWAAPRRWPGSERAFGEGFARLLAQPPSLVVGCGRQAALATRLLRTAGAKAVQILDPRIAPAHWDLVVAPEHDGLRGDNVVPVLGSLHPVDDAWLARARTDFVAFAELPRPRIAVLLGGRSPHFRFDRAAFDTLAAQVEAARARQDGSVLATVSRRTPRAIVQALRERFARVPGLAWCGPEDGPNPYPGLLAWADRIVCSPDSVNMLSEACATTAPVHVFAPGQVGGRPRGFLDTLLARGRIRPMDTMLAPFEATPLRETARVAEVVRQRLRETS